MRRRGRTMTIGFRPYDNNVTATRDGAVRRSTFTAVNSIAKCNAVRKLSPKTDGRRDDGRHGDDGTPRGRKGCTGRRSEEHTSELQSLMRISYAVFCLKKKKNQQHIMEK